jgi:hypothetical protein
MKAILIGFQNQQEELKALSAYRKLYFYIVRAHFALQETNYPKEQERFEQWFGKISKSRLERAKGLIDKIHTAYEDNNIVLIKGGIKCEIDDYAYVSVENEKYEIHLCDQFFLTEDETKFNSTMGTIIHELTHIVGNTNDYEYGEDDCVILAQNDPEKAIENADNYEFYCESFKNKLV